MASVYKGARVCRPALLDDLPEQPGASGEGRGTFVAVGTHIDPFDRLLREVDEAVGRGVLPLPVVAQSGVSQYEPRNFAAVQWMSPHQIDAAIMEHRYTVCHAGSGLIARALGARRKPLVIPRLAEFGEHVDDHQLQIATRLGEYGLVVALEGEITPQDVAAAGHVDPGEADFNHLPRMEDALADELEALFGAPARVRASVR
jgi:UDP-N-acetylglucosamine transferase subunit ALG13